VIFANASSNTTGCGRPSVLQGIPFAAISGDHSAFFIAQGALVGFTTTPHGCCPTRIDLIAPGQAVSPCYLRQAAAVNVPRCLGCQLLPTATPNKTICPLAGLP
jgi:hypothetical protein